VSTYEMSRNQWWFRENAFWRWITRTWPWRAPVVTPLPIGRYVEDTELDKSLIAEVDTKLPMLNRGPFYTDGKIRLPMDYPGYPAIHDPGTPYQVGDSSKGWRSVHWLNHEYGINETVKIPRPVDHNGAWFIEGNPQPQFVLNGYVNDRHIMVYDRATGHYHEAIGFQNGGVESYGEFDENGELVYGKPVIVSKVALGPYIFDPDNDVPHSLTLTVAGDDKAEPTFPWFNRFVTLSPAAKAAIPEFAPGTVEWVFAESLRRFPILIGDHGGNNNFRTRSMSVRLRNVNWQGWTLHLTDLQPCDGKTGP